MILSDELIHKIHTDSPNASHLDFARNIEKMVLVALATGMLDHAEAIEKEHFKTEPGQEG